jgi:putative ABC transport system permease protein
MSADLALDQRLSDIRRCHLPIGALSQRELVMLVLIVGAGFGVALLPALRAYQMSLADGMTMRV